MTIAEQQAALRREIATVRHELALSVPKTFDGTNRAQESEFRAIQAKADRAFQSHRAPMPAPAECEDALAYRKRLAEKLQDAAGLRRIGYGACPETEFSKLESKVYDDAMAAAHAAPDLREIRTQDPTGRACSEFVGSKSSWMSRFKGPVQLMVGVQDRPVVIPTVVGAR
jgi:hypothetical protein